MKLLRYSLCIMIFILSNAALLHSQVYLMPVSGDSIYTTCSGILYDNGGSSMNYSDNAYGTVVLLPESTDYRIHLVFDNFDVNSYGDTLHIFDGDTPYKPMIGSYSELPDPVYSTDATGALTLQFTSDQTINRQGFAASISCISDTFLSELKMNFVEVATPIIYPGSDIGIYSIFSNTGDLIAKDITIGYYLSTDSMLDSTDYSLHSALVNHLYPGSDDSLLVITGIPENATPGNQYVIVKIDYEERIPEKNENNNTISVPVQIQNSVKDLCIDQSGVSEDQPITAGGTIRFWAYVKNTGQQKIDTFKTGFYLSADTLLDASDTLLLSLQRYSLYEGQSRYYFTAATLPDSVPVGTFHLIIYTDYQNMIDETNETNNIAVLTFEIVPKYAELSISNLYSASGFLYKNIINNITCYLRSDGNYTIKDVYTGFYLSEDELLDSSDILIYTAHMEDIQYGRTNHRNVSLRFDNPDNIENGLYFLIVKADSPELIAEKNENNNIYFLPGLVTEYITDVEISRIDALSAALSPDAGFMVKCDYHNNSAMKVNEFRTYFYLSTDTLLNIPNDSLPDPFDDIYLGYQRINSINPNSTYSESSNIYLLDTVAYGDYYLIGIADPENTLDESDTTNNVKFIPISVEDAIVDLEMAQIDLPLNIFRSSQSTYGTARIINKGNQYINYNRIGCYLSADSIQDPDDRYLRTEYIYDLYPKDTLDAPVRIPIPSDQAEGEYYILMFVDNYNYISESNENNNTKYAKITIDNSIYTGPYPELSLAGCSLGNSSVASGDYVDFNGTAVNLGNAVSEVRLAYYLSTDSILNIEDLSHRLYEASFYSMGQGYSSLFSHSFMIPQSYNSGHYYLIAKIDDYNTVFEDDESNNIVVIPLQINPSTIDLFIDYVSMNSPIVLKGGSEQISINVRNGGSSVSPASQAAYYLSAEMYPENDGILIGTSAIPSIGSQGSGYTSFNLQIHDSIPEGVYYLKIIADNKDAVMETNEENNAWFCIVGAMNQDVDFRTDHIGLGTPDIIPGTSVYVNYDFYNDGTTKSPEAKLGYFLSADTIFDPDSDELIGYENIYGLERNSYRFISDYIQIPSNIGPGQYRLFLFSDYLDLVEEKWEDNNLSFIDFVIHPSFVDLTIENLTTNKNTVAHGEQIYVTCRIRNTGNSSASSSYVGYYLSVDSILDTEDILLGDEYVYSLYGNDYSSEYHYIKMSGDLDTGTYHILVYADYRAQIQESDENNNLAFKIITLQEAEVDIMITNLSVDNNSLFGGSYSTIRYTVKNNGTTGCPQFQTRFYLSEDTILNPLEDSYIGYYTSSSISAGNTSSPTASVNVPQIIIKGTYHLFAVADMLNVVEETDESNNHARIIINLIESYADLVVTDATLPGNIYYPGDYVYVSFYIRNTGNLESNSGYVFFYFSNDSVYDVGDILITNIYYSYVPPAGYRYFNTGISIPYGPVNDECYILIVADHYNNTVEKNENNNMLALPISIQSIWFTDLRADWNINDKYEYNYGDSVKGTYYFTMSGIDTISHFYTGFYLSSDDYYDPDDYLLSEMIITAPFTDTIFSYNMQFKITDYIEPGIYYVLGIIDSRNEVNETDEDNNVGWFRISLANNTDLRSGWDTHEKYSYYTGDTIESVFSFPYSGRDSISPFYTAFYLSSDEHPDPTDYLLSWTESTGPFTDNIISMNVRLVIPDTIESGIYNILGIIDMWNNISETDEDNNIHSFEIELSKKIVSISLEEISSTVFYPNPALSYVYILNEQDFKYLKIFNSSGMLVRNLKIQRNLNIVDISGLLPGDYTILLIDNNKTEQLKFVKIREQ